MWSSHEHVFNIRPFDVVDLLLSETMKLPTLPLNNVPCEIIRHSFNFRLNLLTRVPVATIHVIQDVVPDEIILGIRVARLCDSAEQITKCPCRVCITFACLLAGCSKHMYHLGSADSTTSYPLALCDNMLVVGLRSDRQHRVWDFLGLRSYMDTEHCPACAIPSLRTFLSETAI